MPERELTNEAESEIPETYDLDEGHLSYHTDIRQITAPIKHSKEDMIIIHRN